MCNSTKYSQPPRSKASRFGVIPMLKLLTLELLSLRDFSFGHLTGMWSCAKL
ncbi:hypothetical protein HanXRQr2_Chr09g0363751 [Helianthus annuus]|uniref:Uncharacterized protein n=1 Tax=Helianthus annuus TaxID=4232 RepID=A0A9K3I1K6_HELAN|nr:hypothetical protein HanXRQr2_Chr09g0363751 [Helianthus annuus]KAJ0891211.1 hypothetical protein HanPSC8_Chr09g0350931 [Helianthus annuus]